MNSWRETAVWQMCTVVISSALFVCDQRGLLKLNRNVTTAQIPYSNHEILSCCGACQLPFCYVYISWWILKKKKKICFYSRGRVYTDIVTSVGQVFPRNTRVFQLSILLPDSHLMCFVCPQSAKLLFSLRLAMCVCVFGVREGGFFWGGKWSGLCVHRGIQSCPQSHRGSTTIPPRVLNYYHIYTFMWPLLCKICKICSVFLFLCLPNTWLLYFWKTQWKVLFGELPPVRSCTPRFHCSVMQEKFASLSFDALYFFTACAFLNFWPLCLSHLTAKTRRSRPEI